MLRSLAAVALLGWAGHGVWAAEPVKTLRSIFPAAETGFDPAIARDRSTTKAPA